MHLRALSALSTLDERRLATVPEPLSVLIWQVRPRDDLHVVASVEL
jgi:hypothetical protein